MSRHYHAILMVVVLSFVAFHQVQGEAPSGEIDVEAISPRDIVLLELPEGSQTSSGLPVVGVGRRVYLSAEGSEDPDGSAIGSYMWEITAKPDGSAATIESPYASIPHLATFVPDLVGSYTVSLTVTDGQGESSEPVSKDIVAGTWVGVGTVGGGTPDTPKGQCGTCHSEKTTEWEATDHATMLERNLDGEGSSHYAASCISCHTVGYDEAETAVNNGFDDVMKSTGWTFPDSLQSGNFDAMPMELKTLANIQCENCHGPGSEHKGNKAKTATSFDSGVCAQCHDSGSHHVRPYQWDTSKHAVATSSPTGEGRESCVQCHSGIGFAEYAETGTAESLDYAPITCVACHDPHSADEEYQLRKLDDVTLENGEVVTSGGLGQLCMNCHRSRRNVEEYVQEYHSHYGPHYGPQADMLAGTNAVEYGETVRNTTHNVAVSDGCVGCHMSSDTPGEDEPGYLSVGEHTFAMTWDAETPDDPTDDVENVGACAGCHGEIETFDKLASADYDGDGELEGVQTEVRGLMRRLALELPPMGEPEVEVTEEYTPAQLKAAYNYLFVEEDGSYGIHNTKYTVGILRLALRDLGVVITSVELDELAQGIPESYALAQNYPNPFNMETVIRYSLPEGGQVYLEIYNALGQRVRTLVSGSQGAGSYIVHWDGLDDQGNDLSSGIYFYHLKAGNFSSSKSMVLLR